MPGVDKISDYFSYLKIMLESNARRTQCKLYDNTKCP